MSSDPTKDLAGFVADLRYEALPAAVRERVIDIILDTVASAIAGRRGDETAQIEALAAAIGGPRSSTVLAGPRRSLAGATLLNGYQVTAVTVCDIHRPTLCHVTPEVVPPALAIAEQVGTGLVSAQLRVVHAGQVVQNQRRGVNYLGDTRKLQALRQSGLVHPGRQKGKQWTQSFAGGKQSMVHGTVQILWRRLSGRQQLPQAELNVFLQGRKCGIQGKICGLAQARLVGSFS